MLESGQGDNDYHRRIVLTLHDSDRIVQYGLVRINLALLDPEAGWSLPTEWSEEPYGAIVYSMGRENVFATVVDGIVRYRASDPTVMGLKPAAAEIRDAVKKLKSRM